jgi:Eukaryotic-type carbonic anhydrase
MASSLRHLLRYDSSCSSASSSRKVGRTRRSLRTGVGCRNGPVRPSGRGGVDLRNVLPARHDVYRYAGSLTTPPCSEGVEWLVLKEHATASAAQIKAFRSIMHHDNRPTQPLAGRAVHSDVIR